MFLTNSWYVAALSEQVNRSLVAKRILDQAIVLYRTEDGTPVALEDACPHRKLPLSKGFLKGDSSVECGYHGLTFNPSGKCIDAATQERIPPSACVRSYPVVDKWGLTWIWMGDAEQADQSQIIDIENFDSSSWTITGGDSLVCACNYLYLTDNLLDPSHVAWVHRSSFAASGTDDTALSIEDTGDGILVSRWIYDQQPPPFYAPLVKFSGHADRLQHYEVRYPAMAINHSVFTPAGKGGPDMVVAESTYWMTSYNFLTPIDEDRTEYFWLQHRNTDIDDQALTEKLAVGAKAAFEEDREILEAVHQGIKTSSSRPINLGLDAGAQRFRRALQKRIDAEVDSNVEKDS